MNILKAIVFSASAAMIPAAAQAVIVYGPQQRNTTAPTGPLANSGWQFQGTWGSFSGTPIAPQHFITAQHVGGSVGNTFTYLSTTYTTTSFYDKPGTDLRVWKVDGVFPTYAPLYTKSNESGQDMVVIGRGTQRGAVVSVSPQDKGWSWGAIDGVQSWGTNNVAATITDPTYGPMLAYDFSAGGGSNEGTLSDHDSGGAVYIKDLGTWKLAGINFGATGPYKFQPSDSSSFNASLYDQSGLFVNNGSQWVPASNSPGYSVSSRISPNVEWINSVVPEPASLSMAVVVAGLFLCRRHR